MSEVIGAGDAEADSQSKDIEVVELSSCATLADWLLPLPGVVTQVLSGTLQEYQVAAVDGWHPVAPHVFHP